MSKKTFLLSDETINSYGFWVKTTGIDLSRFKKNSVMLYNHERYGVLPIGMWTNIRVDEGKILADAEFDMEDDFAKEVSRKVDKGYIKGVSIGFEVLSISEDEKDLKKGQTRSTVTAARITEASITPFPANHNALKLKYKGKVINLSSENEKEIDEIFLLNKSNNMKKIALSLGLPDSATEEQIIAAITELSNSNKSLKGHLHSTFLKLGEKTGVITKDNKEKMEKLAQADYDLALSFVDVDVDVDKKDNGDKTSLSEKKEGNSLRLSDLIRELTSSSSTDEIKKDFDWYQNNDPKGLAQLKAKDPKKFQEMFNEYLTTK